MREITTPTALVSPGGRLVRDAVGFSRRPLHTTDHLPHGALHGWRTKKWDYWGITSPELAIGLTVADLDYGAVLQLYCHDRSTGETITSELTKLPTPRERIQLPTGLPPFFVFGTVGDMSVRFDAAGENHTVLRVETERVSTVLEVDARGESLSVVVPWSENRFQYTVKGPALPVSGIVMIDGREIRLEDNAWATLDRGRGRWKFDTAWNWATGSGINPDGLRLGLQAGARWTDGTGSTENALVVDGILDGPRPDAAWTYDLKNPEGPWRLRGSWIDATLTPWHVRHASTSAGIVSGTTVQAFGDWSGSATLSNGRRVSLDGLTGWAEDAHNRW